MPEVPSFGKRAEDHLQPLENAAVLRSTRRTPAWTTHAQFHRLRTKAMNVCKHSANNVPTSIPRAEVCHP